MTLEQVAALGEVVASVGVILSLIYVARQLRQNTAMMRASASAERVERDAELSFRLVDHPEFAEIWVRAHSDLESLGEVERTRLIFFSRTAIVHWHNMFRLREQGLLPDADWEELKWLIRLVGVRQDTRAAWHMFRESFEDSFQAFMDAQLAKASPET